MGSNFVNNRGNNRDQLCEFTSACEWCGHFHNDFPGLFHRWNSCSSEVERWFGRVIRTKKKKKKTN